MKNSINFVVFFIIFYTAKPANAQIKVKDTVVRKATIDYNQKKNIFKYSAETPTLIPIAGAPKPFYTYFWEFGDGNYSKVAAPKHVYKNKGNHNIKLSVTNNYDNGKPPATRPKTVTVNEISGDEKYTDIAGLSEMESLEIQKNCDPIPEQEIVVYLRYKNPENYVSDGKIYLFYNEKQFKNNNFELLDCRTHAGEKETKETSFAANFLEDSYTYLANNTSYLQNNETKKNNETDLDFTLSEAYKNYHNVSILSFDGRNPNETHTVFYSFKTTPEMIKDTSATVSMRSIYVPNRSNKNHTVKNLEMEIVTSHDPNKMSSNGSFMNYRLVRFKRVNFKTKFQNNGEGPARKIKLETDIPDMFDKKTFEIEDMYPKCPICPKNEEPTTSCLDTIILKNQIHFTFRNIYLPGSNQKNVKEKDSTKGFVKYSMKFNKDFHKMKTKSRTAIIFDKNEPIITNYATTRFLPGISIGAKMGYNYYTNLQKSTSYFVGATISPFKSYRLYWQAEWLNGTHNYTQKNQTTETIVQNGNGIRQLQLVKTQNFSENITTEIPLLVRYNINNYIGIGLGIQANLHLSSKIKTNTITELYETEKPQILLNTTSNNTQENQKFKNFQQGFLLDLTLGAARIGPSLGARYVLNLKENFNYLQLYGIWKF